MQTVSDADKAVMRTEENATFYVTVTKSTAGAWADGYAQHLFSIAPVSHGGGIASTRYFGDRMDKKSINNVSYAVDSREIGGISKIGTLEFTIADDDNLIYGLNASGIYYEGHSIGLWFYFKASSGGTADLLLWRGFVVEVDRDPVKKTTTMRCESHEKRYNKEAPPNIYESGAATPAWLSGIRKQLVFGNHPLCPGVRVTNVTGAPRGGDKGPTIEFADASIADGIFDIVNLEVGDNGLVEATGGSAAIDEAVSPYTADAATASIAFDTIPVPASGESPTVGVVLLINAGEFVTGGADVPALTDEEWATMVDDDDDTYVDVTVTNTWVVGGVALMPIKLPPITAPGSVTQAGGTAKVYLAFRIMAWTHDGSPNPPEPANNYLRIHLAREKLAAGIGYFEVPIGTEAVPILTSNILGSTGAPIVNASASEITSLTELGGAYMRVSQEARNAYTIASLTARIYEIRGLAVYATMDMPERDGFYAKVYGYKDDVAGTITGTTGDLIESIAHVCRFIATKLTTGPATADADSFNALDAARPAWDIARAISEKTDTDEMLNDLAAAGNFWLWVDRNGAYRAFTADAVAVPSFTLSRSMVVKGRISSAKLTPLEDVATSFTFRARPNTIADGYGITLNCSESAATYGIANSYKTLCADAKARYTGGVDVAVTVDCDWIRSTYTALLWAKRVILWRTRRRWIIEYEADLELLYVEMGDTFDLAPGQWSDLPPDISGAQFVVTGVGINTTKDIVTITAIQTA